MGSMGRKMESDELAVVKAAAWAWYQHGSGCEGKPMREFDVTTRLQYSDSASASASTRPSRYKLEAMRMRNNIMSPTINSNESDSLLLDSYEIQSISKRLNHLIEFSGIKVYDEFMQMQDHIIGTDHDEYDYQKKNQNNMSSEMGGGSGSGSRKKKKKSKYRQFLKGFLQRHAVVCGRSQDVDDRSSPIFRLRPQINN
ncbi:hypothetical protein CCACVL1_06837 [Corchorus capsularis]|uniref:Uncharacterized protein n=1 Tax=Corchorus capsularis TaxID=210143 RepID=A0A1R3JCH5_COCAP|nr:hypothetical protein CCACVL1_06837 [Corchorus capsularis]